MARAQLDDVDDATTSADHSPPDPGWRQRSRRLRRVLVVTDAAVIALSSLLAYLLRNALGELGVVRPLANEIPVALGVLPLWLVILHLFGCYRPHLFNAEGDAFRRFLSGTIGGVLVLGFVSFALDLEIARLYVLFLFLLVLLIGATARAAIRRRVRTLRASGRHLRQVLIVGSDDEAVEVARAIARDPGAGYRVIGFVDNALAPGAAVADGLQVVGRTDQILHLAQQTAAALVVVSPTGVAPGTLRDVTIALEGSPVDLAVAPSLFQVVTRRVTVEAVGDVPLLHVDQIRLGRAQAAQKRALDVLASVSLLVVLAPVMLAAAVMVKLGDGGPVLFRQRRLGRDGREFVLPKFRTMVPDAETLLDEVADLNEAGHHFFKVRTDPRVTRVGRVLRKWSIDETPQLWTVFLGRMSMVGPRPPLPREVEQYEAWHLRRLRVKPGVTGVWQVSGRSTVPFDEAVRLDLFYIENWSLGYDLFILAKTVGAVLGRSGAW